MKNLIVALACLFLTQCISTRVAPLASGTVIDKVHIVRNDKVHMSGMLPEIEKQIQAMGYNTEVVSQPPAGNEHYLTFTANWRWDMALYLSYFKATLNEGPRVIATGEYDALKAGLNLGKFGHTDEKITPVLLQLFGKPVPKVKKIRKPTSVR